MYFQIPAWDAALFRLINQQSTSHPLLDSLMLAFSWPGWIWCAVLAGLIWLVRRHGWRGAVPLLLLGLAVGMTNLSSDALKSSVGRVRPLNAQAGARFYEDGEWRSRPPAFIQVKPRGNAYPSSHAANAMAAAVACAILWPATRRWVWLLPLLSGVSRIYLGKHYPSDVLGGWGLGLVVGGLATLAGIAIIDRLRRRWPTLPMLGLRPRPR